MATELSAVDYLTRTVDRNRYFYGKLMTVRDFLREQEYFNSKRWLINRLLFGGGIVCGLEVALAGGSESPTLVELQPGLAFDPLGREITVLEHALVDLSKVVTEKVTQGLPSEGAAESNLLVCLNYHECPKEPVPSLGGSPCEEACESNRVGETYTVSLIPAPPDALPPTPCEKWLNRQTVPRQSANFDVERYAPVWVRQGEVFEVALKVTARGDINNVVLNETVTNGTLVEPNPQPPTQFPTPPISLRKGEFFIYVYQVQAPTVLGFVQLSGGAGVPTPPTRVEVVDQMTANAREEEKHLGPCPTDPEEKGVPVARIKAVFDSKKLTGVTLLDADRQRFRYSLAQVAELLDCVRTSLRAADGSPRPGHAFITFKDLERTDLQPVGPTADHGDSFTVPRGDHVHALLLYTDSGLQFVGNQLRVEGNVGGQRINFLNPVSGQDPVEPQHLTTKNYVDSRIAGLDWQESVITRKLFAPPDEPKEGDRYLISPVPPDVPSPPKRNPWAVNVGKIATWDGKKWDYTAPDEGTAVFVDDENIAYLFVEGKWIPFLATPEVAAGDGLRADGAVLSVGQGPGLQVNPNDVEVVFEANPSQPVGPKEAAGSSNTSARGDHTHALPLTPKGGLDFGPLKGPEPGPGLPKPDLQVGLHIEGPVGGVSIDFLNPVWGQSPTEPRHLATKQYVDGLAAGLDWQNSVLDKDLTVPPDKPEPGERYLVLSAKPLPTMLNVWTEHEGSITTWDGSVWTFTAPSEGMAVFVEDENTAYLFVDGKWVLFMAMPSVAAGAGLFADGPGISVGGGNGLRVNENNVEVVYYDDKPLPVGQVINPGASDALSRGDHTHELQLDKSGGLEFVGGDKTDVRLRINGRINGEAVEFLNPVLGQDPFDPRHLATKQYVDGTVAGLTWQSTVLDKDLGKPPEEPKRGDRYLLFAKVAAGCAWEGQQDNIATWTSRKWDFTAPSEGMAAFVADENLAYLYADGKCVQFLAPPAAVGAGDGLIQKGTDLAVGQGEGVVVTPDAVSVNFGAGAPPPVGASASAGSMRQAAQSDHTHALLLAASAGLEFVSGAAGPQLRLNGLVGGNALDFQAPVKGQSPTDPRHLATKQYVDSKGGGTVAAGDGLVNNVNGLSVVGGPGLVVNPDEVHVNFEDQTAQPVGDVSSPGRSNAVARGDHTHALPDVWGMNVSTGVVAFNMKQTGSRPHVTSLPIDPELGPGPVSVILGLESDVQKEALFVGNVEQFEEAIFAGGEFEHFPSVLLAAAVIPPGLSPGFKSTTFEIWAQATRKSEVLPETFSVRWWAYRPGRDFGVIDYTPPAPR